MTTIRGAAAHIEQHTCVRFRELQTHEPFYDNHVLVTRQRTGYVPQLRRHCGVVSALNLFV